MRWSVLAGTITGIAAAILVWINWRPTSPTLTSPNNSVAVVADQSIASPDFSLLSMPQYFEITPPAEQFDIPALPSMPAWDDLTYSTSPATTQESV